jgi:hypothetical protein
LTSRSCSAPRRRTRKVLQHAQQLGLQRQVELADLVQEQRAAVGGLDQADLARLRVGEGALLMAEQLALDQVRRQRGAVDFHERGRGARTGVVAGARHQLLAGAGLAQNQHGPVQRGPPAPASSIASRKGQ